jgi:uncharacterized membrane protein
MATDIQDTENASMASLVKGIIDDASELVKQQIAMAKWEVQNEINKGKQAAAALAIGAGLAAVGGLLLCFGLVHMLHTFVPDLPLWACYLIVGGLFAVAGGLFLYTGSSKAADINLVPEQTIETAKENAQWIQNHA